MHDSHGKTTDSSRPNCIICDMLCAAMLTLWGSCQVVLLAGAAVKGLQFVDKVGVVLAAIAFLNIQVHPVQDS